MRRLWRHVRIAIVWLPWPRRVGSVYSRSPRWLVELLLRCHPTCGQHARLLHPLEPSGGGGATAHSDLSRTRLYYAPIDMAILQNVFHRISCARINRRNRRNRPCMETNRHSCMTHAGTHSTPIYTKPPLAILTVRMDGPVQPVSPLRTVFTL